MLPYSLRVIWRRIALTVWNLLFCLLDCSAVRGARRCIIVTQYVFPRSLLKVVINVAHQKTVFFSFFVSVISKKNRNARKKTGGFTARNVQSLRYGRPKSRLILRKVTPRFLGVVRERSLAWFGRERSRVSTVFGCVTFLFRDLMQLNDALGSRARRYAVLFVFSSLCDQVIQFS